MYKRTLKKLCFLFPKGNLYVGLFCLEFIAAYVLETIVRCLRASDVCRTIARAWNVDTVVFMGAHFGQANAPVSKHSVCCNAYLFDYGGELHNLSKSNTECVQVGDGGRWRY